MSSSLMNVQVGFLSKTFFVLIAEEGTKITAFKSCSLSLHTAVHSQDQGALRMG